MPPSEYRVYVFHGYVECFIHASSNYMECWHRAKLVAGAHLQKRRTGDIHWGRGIDVNKLSTPMM